jgi:predicted metal-dependent peptidase
MNLSKISNTLQFLSLFILKFKNTSSTCESSSNVVTFVLFYSTEIKKYNLQVSCEFSEIQQFT